MIIDRGKVIDACKNAQTKYDLEWQLLYAICLQEGQKSKTGEFDPAVARLEQGYYRAYVENMDLATSSEILLSASWGVMQLMGLSLLEMEYFEWYFNQCPEGMKAVLKGPRTQFAIPNALDAYAMDIDLMVDWGTQWLQGKIKQAKGNIWKGVLRWNGGGNAAYPDEVRSKYLLIKQGRLQ